MLSLQLLCRETQTAVWDLQLTQEWKFESRSGACEAEIMQLTAVTEPLQRVRDVWQLVKEADGNLNGT